MPIFFIGVSFIPARVRMRMTVKFEGAISLHRLDFAPAQYDVVAAALLDKRFTLVVGRGRGKFARLRPAAPRQPAIEDAEPASHRRQRASCRDKQQQSE